MLTLKDQWLVWSRARVVGIIKKNTRLRTIFCFVMIVLAIFHCVAAFFSSISLIVLSYGAVVVTL